MITINVIDNKICGSYGETPFAVEFSKELFDKMTKLAYESDLVESIEDYNAIIAAFAPLCVVDFSAVIETECKYIHVNKATGEFFLKHDSVTSSIPMPQALVDRIFDSMDKDLDFMPLVKMWTRWLRNPILWEKSREDNGENFSRKFFEFINMQYVHPKLKDEFIEKGLTEEAAAARATVYQMKITSEGLLNGYKVSKEILHKFDRETGEQVDRYKRTFNIDTGEIDGDGIPEQVEDRLFQPAMMGTGGDAFFCEGDNGYTKPGHFIKVGCVHRLATWDQVNTNDNASCVKGLHIGGLKYINNYSGEVHNIFVDPMHIGAVPDSTDGAIRCKQYFVHSSLAGVNGSIYHSSTYASRTDAEWDVMRKEAVEKMAAIKAECDKTSAEVNSI